jgi:hypothetical protein
MDRGEITTIGICISIIIGLYGAIRNTQPYMKATSVLLSLGMCIGFGYFGYCLYYGDHQHAETYFGCIMLTFSLILWVFVRGVSVEFERLAERSSETNKKSNDREE